LGGINTSFNLDNKIDDVLVIDTKNFDLPGPKINYNEIKNKNLHFIPSFNILDRVNDLTTTEYENSEINELSVPDFYANQGWLNYIKIYSKAIKYKDACRILNHAICWVKCMEINKPVVVLENGSMLTKQHTLHLLRGSINALGSKNYHIFNTNVICNPSPWAYSIDTISARILFEDLLSNGLTNPLPLLMTVNKLPIICMKKAVRIQLSKVNHNTLTARL
jgi:hypothetical protein